MSITARPRPTTPTTPAAPVAGTAPAADTAARDRRAQRWAMARTFGLDVVGPIVLQHGLTRLGWSEVHALMAAAVLPAVGLIVDKARGHRLGGLGILVLAGMVGSIVLGLLSGNARIMLLEGGINSAAMGVFAVVTLFTKRTLVELFAGAAGPADTPTGRVMIEAFARPDVRRLARGTTVVFAAVFLVSAAIQIGLATWAPIGLAFAYNRFGFVPCLAVIAGLTWALVRRALARGELAGLGDLGREADEAR